MHSGLILIFQKMNYKKLAKRPYIPITNGMIETGKEMNKIVHRGWFL